MSEMNKGAITKTFADSYLYNSAIEVYEKNIINFIMHGEEVNKQNSTFEDIRYEVKKRQVTNVLTKVLDSNKVILLMQPKPLPKAFKVFMTKDLKGDKKNKVFIDADVVKLIDGKYMCSNTDILVAYLLNAMNQIIYYTDPKRIVMRGEIIANGADMFSKLFTHIIDYLYKVSSTPNVRDKCLYLSSLYYLVCILKKDINDSNKHICKKISGLSEREEELLLIQLDQEKAFLNIRYFIEELSKILRLPKLTLDAFLEKWLYLYGVGTQFALELYPSFASMITNAYVGCYLNNQKTIEKIVGRDMVDFTNAIFRVGEESV